MSNINPNATQLIDEAFAKFTGFQKAYCNYLRALIHKALPDVIEDWKWGPNFNVNGMVCGVWGFKNHVKLVFFKGSLMKDEYGLFNNGEGNEGNRSIDFSENDKIDDEKVIAYLKEAAEINNKGLKPEKKPIEVNVPDDLNKAFKANDGLRRFFEKLAPSHKREYVEYIADAKQTETRERRIKKVLEMLADNKKLNEKYETKKRK